MKIEMKKDFSKTLNLPKKTIEVDGDFYKKEDYLINKIQEQSKFTEAMEENINNGIAINISQVPLEFGDTINSTQIINQVLKDIVLRYKLFKGNVIYHNIGFIEKDIVVEYQLKQKKINEQIKYRLSQKKELENKSRALIEDIRSLGTIINYNKSKYTTINTDFEISAVKEFYNSYKENNIYTKTKPVHFCPSCKNVVLRKDKVYEKEDKQNIYVLYKIKEDNGIFKKYSNLQNTYIIANTIRPWTLESSTHLLACKDVKYSLVQIKGTEKNIHYIIASDNVTKVMENSFYLKYEILETFDFDKLSDFKCEHPLNKEKIIDILFVTKDKVILNKNSTGIGILSANNTYLDYLISSELNLDNNKNILEVDGKINNLAIKFKNIDYKEASEKIVNYLEEEKLLFSKFQTKETVVKCKKCSTELIYRGIKEWYIKRDENKIDNIYSKIDALSKKLDTFNFYGDVKKSLDHIKNISELKISSDSYMSTPIPAFYCADCGRTILNDKTMDIIVNFIKEKGLESWYKYTSDQIFGGQVACTCGCGFFFKEELTMNNLYKLSKTPFIFKDEKINTINICIENKNDFFKKILAMSFNSDFIEIIDNIDYILLHSVIKENKYLEKQNEILKDNIKKTKKKQSNQENLNNKQISIVDVIQKYGNDVLRLWTIYKYKRNNVEFNNAEFLLIDKSYRKIRRTFKFILSNISDLDISQEYILLDDRTDLDKYEYAKLMQNIVKFEEVYRDFDFTKLYGNIIDYCNELCKDFFDAIKYKLYVLPKNDKSRLSTQSTLKDILNALIIYVGPILPFIIEEIWPFVLNDKKRQKNPMLYRLNLDFKERNFNNEYQKWNKIFILKNKIILLIEKAKREKIINDTLEAKVVINTTEKAKIFVEENYEDILRSLNVSVIEVKVSDKKEAEIYKAEGVRCARCYNYSLEIGKNFAYRYLCPKCAQILEENKNNK